MQQIVKQCIKCSENFYSSIDSPDFVCSWCKAKVYPLNFGFNEYFSNFKEQQTLNELKKFIIEKTKED